MTTACRYFDGLTALPQEVAAILSGGMLVLHRADGGVTASWPVHDIECAATSHGPAATLRLKGGAARLHLPDAELLNGLRAGGANLGAPRAVWRVKQWAGLAAGLVLSVAAAALLLDRLPALLAPLVPHRLEDAWSGNVEAVLAVAGHPCTGTPGVAALDGLTARLAQAAGITPVPDVTVLDSGMVNAFTLPNGRILVMRGLIARADGPDEVAGVMAHEMGHVLHRDATREMLRRIAVDMVARSLGWGGGVAGSVTTLSYGRRAEAAADDAALTTLDRAGLRADGLSSFFGRLERDSGDAGLPAFLSDHPSTASRATRLHRGATGQTALGPAEWNAVQLVCGPR